jgi:SAM-dependent methyltransferase
VKDLDWTRADSWDAMFRKGDKPWDLEGPSRTLVLLEAQARGPGRRSGRALIPGCGEGNDALEFAGLGYSVTAADWSGQALRQLAQRAKGLQLEIATLEGDFFALKLAPASFDLWVEHTFFCAIDPSRRAEYVRTAAAALKPGADLLGNFFVSREPLTRLSLSDDGRGPPFLTHEPELRSHFERDFEILSLEPTPEPHPERKPGIEWAAHFRRKPLTSPRA